MKTKTLIIFGMRTVREQPNDRPRLGLLDRIEPISG